MTDVLDPSDLAADIADLAKSIPSVGAPAAGSSGTELPVPLAPSLQGSNLPAGPTVPPTAMAMIGSLGAPGSMSGAMLAPGSVPGSAIAPGGITGIQLDDYTLTLNKFAALIRPVPIVTSLPALPDVLYPIGQTVLLTTDSKTYTNKDNSWQVKLDGADIIAGSISAAALAASIVLASVIMTAASGARCLISSAGFQSINSANETRVWIPNNDDPVQFTAAIQATTLTVIGSASFQAAVSLEKNAIMTLQAGVQPPAIAPVLTQDYEQTTGIWWSYLGTNGYWDTAGGAGGATACFVGPVNDGQWKVRETSLAGTVLRDTNINAFVDPSWRIYGMCRVGAYWYFTLGAGDGSTLYIGKLDRATATSWTTLTANIGGDFYGRDSAPIKSDGTYLYVLGQSTTYLNAKVRKYNTSGVYQSQQTLTMPSAPGSAVRVQAFWEITGGKWYIAWVWSDSGWNVLGTPTIYQYTIAGGTIDSGYDWPCASEFNANAANRWNSLIHDGSNFYQVYKGDSTGSFTKFTNEYWGTDKVYVGASWLDDAGTTHETAIGPRSSITMNNRARLSVTTPTIPTGGADDPNKVAIYAYEGATDPGAGAFWRQVIDALTQRYLTSYTGSGTHDGTGTAFPGGVGATMQSSDGTTWDLHGDGTGKMPSGVVQLTSTGAFLTGAVTLTNANQFYDGPSISCTEGTWLVYGAIEIHHGTAAVWCTGRLVSNGATVEDRAALSSTAGGGVSIPLVGIVTVPAGSTYTVKLQGACNAATTGTIYVTSVNGTTNKATHIAAVRIA